MTDAIANRPIFTVDRNVAFQDIDAAGLVFFGRFFEYCHDVLFAFLAAQGVHMDEVLARGVWGCPIAHAEADFMVPLRFGDRVRIAVEKVAIGSSSIRLDYKFTNVQAQDACRIHMVHVFIDRARMLPCRAPDEVRDALKDLATFEAPT